MDSAARKANEDKERAIKIYSVCFVVAALLATSALYGGVAMLYHVQNDFGPEILTRKAAFVTFAIADAVYLISAMVSSFIAFRCWLNVKRNGALRKSEEMATSYYSVTQLALLAMVLSHISSTYALYGMRLLGMVEMVAFYFVFVWYHLDMRFVTNGANRAKLINLMYCRSLQKCLASNR